MKIRHYTIPIFIPQKGCPFECVFCNQKKISGEDKPPSSEEIKKIIELHLTTIPKTNTFIEAGFFGGSFTGLPLKEQESYLKEVLPYIKENSIQGIRLSTRPDYINKEILDFLKAFDVNTIELGAQSFDDEVLFLSGRGHTSKQTVLASLMVKEAGFKLGLQMMIGLPGDSFEKAFFTARKIAELKADCVRIYPALVIRGTKLEEIYKQGLYHPLTMDEAVGWSKEIYKIFEESFIPVIRMGLHPSEGLLGGRELVAGPFHQSFRELVLTELWRNSLSSLAEKKSDNKITIFVPRGKLNYAAGYQGKNSKMLASCFKKVSFKVDSNLSGRNYSVNYN